LRTKRITRALDNEIMGYFCPSALVKPDARAVPDASTVVIDRVICKRVAVIDIALCD
jgi:hypothetical protein